MSAYSSPASTPPASPTSSSSESLLLTPRSDFADCSWSYQDGSQLACSSILIDGMLHLSMGGCDGEAKEEYDRDEAAHAAPKEYLEDVFYQAHEAQLSSWRDWMWASCPLETATDLFRAAADSALSMEDQGHLAGPCSPLQTVVAPPTHDAAGYLVEGIDLNDVVNLPPGEESDFCVAVDNGIVATSTLS